MTFSSEHSHSPRLVHQPSIVDLGHQQPHAVLVDRALGHADDAAERARDAVERLLDVLAEHADALALARKAPLRDLFLRALQPAPPRSCRRGFHLMMNSTLSAANHGAVLGRVVAAVETRQQPMRARGAWRAAPPARENG